MASFLPASCPGQVTSCLSPAHSSAWTVFRFPPGQSFLPISPVAIHSRALIPSGLMGREIGNSFIVN